MFSSNVWSVVTIVLALVAVILFGTGSTWEAAVALIGVSFSGLWTMAKLEDEHKATNINW